MNTDEGSAQSTEPATIQQDEKKQYASRLSNLQKIRQKKQQIPLIPLTRKLQKLAIYSKCQVRVLGTF